MNLSEYQQRALKTDQVPDQKGEGIIIPLLGLVGEAGSLLTEYKKYLRDKDSHKLFKDCIAEELGDLLWYVANLASKFDLDLLEIAEDNLKKCHDRWGIRDSLKTEKKSKYFDEDYPENERLPRKLELNFTEKIEGNSVRVRVFLNDTQVGDYLTDNSYSDDGYRFHDVFHFSYMAVLGWSPVTRRNLKCKRKSNLLTDEVEDGGRAIAIEEGISALVFSYAKRHNFLEDISAIDYHLLKTIKNMTEHLEVSRCCLGAWEKAILQGYEVWRQVKNNKGGTVIIDMDKSFIRYKANSQT
ncbi:MAG TPA: nucleoside triphosphate pyrophosphohydrolase family protein [Nostocaceae cyanobacterium]|nr:nucleoside triphosphate pyrophosphohydrolase family protein [Nostocaceae cyanobacterium]